MKTLLITLALAACGGSLPQTRYYQLAAPSAGANGEGAQSIAVEPLNTDGAYDDERIVYRQDPYRLDYYQYHRWSAAPGSMIANTLAQSFAQSGKFRNVSRRTSDAAVIVSGRVVSIEEVDESKTSWHGHLAIELTAMDPKSGNIVWSRMYDESEPLPAQSPEGLARALSAALGRIAAKAAPEIAAIAERQAVAPPVASGPR